MIDAYTSRNTQPLTHSIEQYLSGSMVGLLRVRIVKLLDKTPMSEDDLVRIQYDVKKSHVNRCGFQHHGGAISQESEGTRVIEIIPITSPASCPSLPGNLACGHPAYWTIPLLARLFSYHIQSDGMSEVLPTFKRVRRICDDLFSIDHTHFDNKDHPGDSSGYREIQSTLGDELLSIVNTLSRSMKEKTNKN